MIGIIHEHGEKYYQQNLEETGDKREFKTHFRLRTVQRVVRARSDRDVDAAVANELTTPSKTLLRPGET